MTQLLDHGLPPALIMKAFDGPLVVTLPPRGDVP
jgi:hypothetical protein